jgi:hypothetical protein
LGTEDIRITIAKLIRIAFGLLGIVSVVIIIISGVLFLTSAGDPEKIKKAKEVLIGAFIGLIIMLTAYAIASFVINSLIEATGGGGNYNVNVPPVTDGIGYGCNDPYPTLDDPYICKISGSHPPNSPDNSGAKGSYVTIEGGKFLDYNASNSNVVFYKSETKTEYPATIVLCNNNPSWNNNQIVVKVPDTLPYDATGLNNFQVIVRNANGSSDAKPTGPSLNPNDRFILISGQPGPGLACLVPNQGNENTGVDAYGINFGAAQNDSTLRFNSNKNASVSTWADDHLISSVPPGSVRGDVFVRVNNQDSNGYYFIVTCSTNTDCGSGCCYNGYFGKECADANYCLPGQGQSCDLNNTTPSCELGPCQTGLFCDPASNCTCQPAGVGTDCNQNVGDPVCSPNNNKCGQGLYCSTTATPSCTCQYLPVITDLQPANGAPGNYLTIWGRGFGSLIGQVIFLGDENITNDDTIGQRYIQLFCNVGDIWKDNQIIVAVPDRAVDGPIKIINADNEEDTTSDNDGWKGIFDVNDKVRPGICGLSALSGEYNSPLSIFGNNYGTYDSQKDKALIGKEEFGKGAEWAWQNIRISDALVPNLAPGILPVQVQIDQEYSNPYSFEILISAIKPTIDYIDPVQGPIGQYVTIFGSNFGSLGVQSAVLFDNGNTQVQDWAVADISFPEQCKDQYWHDNYIIVKVPSLSVAPSKIVVRTENGSISNQADFTVTVGTPSPGICRIAPDQGPVGTKGITLYGENFGNLSGEAKVNFWQSKLVIDANLSSYWNNGQVGSGVIGDNAMTVPTGAVKGPVHLINSEGKLSNKIQFNVGDCRTTANLCQDPLSCCDLRDGVCKTQAECKIMYPPICLYNWTFKTGKMPVTLPPPQVIESSDCTETTQSPSPWKNSLDNCINIWLAAKFNQPINFITLAISNIKVVDCGTEQEFNSANCNLTTPLTGDIVAIKNGDNKVTGFTFQPGTNLKINTWYQVTLKSGHYGIKSDSEPGIELDGNYDNIPGGDYVWNFKTRNSDQVCEIDKVVVEPSEALIKLKTQAQEYNAFPLANNCNILNANAYNWNWYKIYSDNTREAAQELKTKYGIAKITLKDVFPKPCSLPAPKCDNNIDYLQVATPEKQGLTFVGAEVFPDDPARYKKDDNNRLVIDLKLPEITQIYPNNGLVRPEVNTYVTITGKNFGDIQGSSQVLFDDATASLADCDNAWTDKTIKVTVPKSQMLMPEGKKTYELPTPSAKDGMILFYNFEDKGTALVKDQINGYDAEIKGQPQRINDQFGQAMYFDGLKDYLKLPNNLENLKTGSIELWFKPEYRLGVYSPLFSVAKMNAPLVSGNLEDNFTLNLTFSAAQIIEQGTEIKKTSNLQIKIPYQDSALDGSALYSNVTLSGPVRFEQWNHLVYTFDGNKYSVYINGVKYYYAVASGGVLPYYFRYTTQSDKGFIADVPDRTDILLGARKGVINNKNFNNLFKGTIDAFAIYNRVLSEAEVWQHYGISKGQSLLLNFDEEGSQLKDSSANNFQNIVIKDPNIPFRINEGKYGKALNFNDNNVIRINDIPSLTFNNEFTAEGWFKVSDAKRRNIIIDTGQVYGWRIGTFCGCSQASGFYNNCQYFCLVTPVADENEQTINYRSRDISTDKIKVNDWNYFAAVFDGKNLKLYLNDNKVASPVLENEPRLAQYWHHQSACIGGYLQRVDPNDPNSPQDCINNAASNQANFSGSLDQIAIYNRALSEAEISSRIGAKDNSYVYVKTDFGEAKSAERFKYSNNVYPFLCSLNPEFGLAGTGINISADNLGDSNKTNFQNKTYGVGSFVHFKIATPDNILLDNNIRLWANKALSIINPFSDIGRIDIPITVSIDPYSEPYNDSTSPFGEYSPCDVGQTSGCDAFADTRDPKCSDSSCYNKEFYAVENQASGEIEQEQFLESNELTFYLPPVITSITPNNGPLKQWVTIRGYNFGDVRGHVYFYNNKETDPNLPPLPCTNTWTDKQIIVVVPDGAESGEVYLTTANNLKSNNAYFQVNNRPLGAGLCEIYTQDTKGNKIIASGVNGEKVYAKGDRFGNTNDNGNSKLVFSNNAPANISLWANTSLEGNIPASAVSGDVVVTKKIETGMVCAGFHIGSWCPGSDINTGQGYDILYEDIQSNPLSFSVNKLNCGLVGKDTGLVGGFPIKPFDDNGPSDLANVAVVAADGTYLYTKAWDSVYYGSPGNIYKIGTGYNGTTLGRIYKIYSGTNYPYYSMTSHSDGNLYAGYAIYSSGKPEIMKIIFNESNNTYSLSPQAISENVYDLYGIEPNNTSLQIMLTSNGNYIFNVGAEMPDLGTLIKKFKVKIFDPQNNWKIVKKFEVSLPDELNVYSGYGLMADSHYLYLLPYGGRKVVVIDWQNESYLDNWPVTHKIPSTELNGQYDWQNRVFWVGDFQLGVMGANNNIYKYEACPLAGACKTDDDCLACGLGTSRCLNGICTPYIKKFSPLSGAVGSWVTLSGCYFGCDPGQVYFWGIANESIPLSYDFSKQALSLNQPECGNPWQCSPDYNLKLDQVIVEVPDKNTPPNLDCPNDGTCPPEGYDANDAIDGPIKLVTNFGLADTTEDIVENLAADPPVSPNFDVNINQNPNICKLYPNYGNRGISVKIIGQGFGDTPEAQDYVDFKPTAEPFYEPFIDLGNDGVYDVIAKIEQFVDFNNNQEWDPDLSIDATNSFQVTQFIDNQTRADCPINGWNNEDICFAVPDNAAGAGTTLGTATDNVSVYKGIFSNPANFTVTFGACGNQEIDSGEACDGINIPQTDCPDERPDCVYICNEFCELWICDEDETDCEPASLCGNDAIDGNEDCDGDNLNDKECADIGYIGGELSCNTDCTFNEDSCLGPEPIQPMVEGTSPAHGEEAFCRNGIIDIYFNTYLNPSTIEKTENEIVTKNIKIESCESGTLTPVSRAKGVLAKAYAYTKNILARLFKAERPALAQLTDCTPLPDDEFSLVISNTNNKTIVQIVTKYLFDPGQSYRVSVLGGETGITSLAGGLLDNINSPVADGSPNYTFEFKTLGEIGDEQSGLCDVQWIDIKVYRQAFTDPNLRESEFRDDDLFICAGKNDCNFDYDTDQDSATEGNQHFYEAVAKYEGGFTLKANFQWSKSDQFDPKRVIEIYNNQDDASVDDYKVKNATGQTFATAKPIKEATASLVIEAQAVGSYSVPAQRDFAIYILMCENPWPSLQSGLIIQSYNSKTYYCRDAGRPGDISDDLPAAKIILPPIESRIKIDNMDFEYGNISNWFNISGDIFRYQPIRSNLLSEGWIINTAYGKISGQTYIMGNTTLGVLQSQDFIIEGTELKYKIGGSQNPWPVEKVNPDINNLDIAYEQPLLTDLPASVTAVTLEIKDQSTGKYYVRMQDTGDNTNLMRQRTFNVSSYLGKIAIIRIYDNNAGGYIMFDDLKQYDAGAEKAIRF